MAIALREPRTTDVAAQVVSLERVPSLAAAARQALEAAGIAVSVVVGDGSLGWAPSAPYDAIVVAAAGPEIPGPLVTQLAEGGRMIIPLDRGGGQELWRLIRRKGEVSRERLGDARFVPLIGRHGFEP